VLCKERFTISVRTKVRVLDGIYVPVQWASSHYRALPPSWPTEITALVHFKSTSLFSEPELKLELEACFTQTFDTKKGHTKKFRYRISLARAGWG
jgi:hypothetical protein